MSASARLFVALEPPRELAVALHARAAELLAPCAAELRRYAPEELHLTLHFLGATDPARIPELAAALARCAARHAPPELAIQGGGAFPDARRPRVIWAGLREAPRSAGRLADLAGAVAAVLGAAPERAPFRAHVTLARPRAGARPRLPEGLAGLELAGTWRPCELVLFESRPGERPRYRALARLPFGG